MLNSKFAIGTYELQLLSNTEIMHMFSKMSNIAEYIDTAINYNNDYVLSDYQQYKIISKIAACHTDYYEFFVSNHLKCLNRNKIDIMLIHSSRGDWSELAKLIVKDKRFVEVGVSNFDVNDIKKFKELTGQYPAYNEIEINPTYLDIETIQFCKQQNIKIIAYCILGGKYNAMKYVATFSLPYLVGFASNYADIVILRTNSITQTNDFINAVQNYDTSNVLFNEVEHNKVMQPMVYKAPTLQKYYANELTYSINCGSNTINKFKNKEIVDYQFPSFEMLGDYLTFIRYMLKTDYSKEVYDYDFLITDDGFEYAFYMFDENNNLTKVNNGSKKQLIKLEVL